MKHKIIILILSFLLGIALSEFLRKVVSLSVLPLILLLFFILLIVFIKTERLFIVCLCLLFFALGVFRYHSSVVPRENDISKILSKENKELVVGGLVLDDPKIYDEAKSQFQLKVYQVFRKGNDVNVSGKILVKLFSYEKRAESGDILLIGGVLGEPRKGKNGKFGWKRYLARQGIHSILISKELDVYKRTGKTKHPFFMFKRYIYRARNVAGKLIGKHIFGDNRTILEAMLLGKRERITREINDIFANTGTIHVLAVSGLHIGIVGAIILSVTRLLILPNNLRYFLAIIGICTFAVFAGGRSSSLRAAIMGSLVLVGMLRGNKLDIVTMLLMSAFIITFISPGELFQIGFILSYFAVLSIIFITPGVEKSLKVNSVKMDVGGVNRAVVFFKKSIAVSVSVWVGVFPLIILWFNIITPYVVVANLVAVPALFLIIILGVSVLFFGIIPGSAPIMQALTWLTNITISSFLEIIRTIENFPFSFIKISMHNRILIVLYYFILIMALFYSRNRAINPKNADN